MIKEELTKLLMEAYERGQSDIIKSCQETVSIAVDTAILAEREACAKVCESIDMEAFGVLPVRAVMITNHCADAIRARRQA